jgi:hypothetical protein
MQKKNWPEIGHITLWWCGPRTRVVASRQSCLDPLQFGPRINITYFGIRRADDRVVADSPVMPRDLQTAERQSTLSLISTHQQNSPRFALGA